LTDIYVCGATPTIHYFLSTLAFVSTIHTTYYFKILMARKLPWHSSNKFKASNTNPRNDTRPAFQHHKLPTSDDESNRNQADDVRETPSRARFKARASEFNVTPLIAAITSLTSQSKKPL